MTGVFCRSRPDLWDFQPPTLQMLPESVSERPLRISAGRHAHLPTTEGPTHRRWWVGPLAMIERLSGGGSRLASLP